jgi:hypothetical protein
VKERLFHAALRDLTRRKGAGELRGKTGVRSKILSRIVHYVTRRIQTAENSASFVECGVNKWFESRQLLGEQVQTLLFGIAV